MKHDRYCLPCLEKFIIIVRQDETTHILITFLGVVSTVEHIFQPILLRRAPRVLEGSQKLKIRRQIHIFLHKTDVFLTICGT